ncbi:hypothetical protein GEV33_002746 [Tenebrio molitor]|uniref:Uncharacterized protein n=1 Tax=Tenebrio molitor TaxID=7067 RepID=A0A8J6HJR5_TENMO|nr:hypothetical protein GEV33_002746 [Tenebrio molitor]
MLNSVCPNNKQLSSVFKFVPGSFPRNHRRRISPWSLGGGHHPDCITREVRCNEINTGTSEIKLDDAWSGIFSNPVAVDGPRVVIQPIINRLCVSVNGEIFYGRGQYKTAKEFVPGLLRRRTQEFLLRRLIQRLSKQSSWLSWTNKALPSVAIFDTGSEKINWSDVKAKFIHMAGAERVPECAAPEKKRRCDNDERINEGACVLCRQLKIHVSDRQVNEVRTFYIKKEKVFYEAFGSGRKQKCYINGEPEDDYKNIKIQAVAGPTVSLLCKTDLLASHKRKLTKGGHNDMRSIKDTFVRHVYLIFGPEGS